MPRRTSTTPQPLPRDLNLLARALVGEAVGDENLPQLPPVPDADSTPGSTVAEKNPAAVALGRLGGQKGGAARAARLTAEERSEIARKAAAARWRK